MAILYSYPQATPDLVDLVLGSKFINGEGLVAKSFSISEIADLVQHVERPYEVYTALLTQSGTNAPVATVLENTLGVDITWTYISTGNYVGTIPSGTFTADAYLTTPSTAIQTAANNINYKVALRIDNSDVTYKSLVLTTLNCNSGNLVNSVLGNQPIEIRVYN